MFASVHRGRSFDRERGVWGGRAARAGPLFMPRAGALSAGRGGAGEGFRLPGTVWMLSSADGAERSWLGAAVRFRKRSREQNVAPCGEGSRALAALQDPGQRAGRGRPPRVSDRGPALPPHPEPVAFVSLWPRRTGAVGEGQARPGRPVGPLGGLRDRNAHGVLPGATRCAPRCRCAGRGSGAHRAVGVQDAALGLCRAQQDPLPSRRCPVCLPRPLHPRRVLQQDGCPGTGWGGEAGSPRRGQAVRHPPRPPGLLPRAVPVLPVERVAEREHVTAGGWKCSSLGKDG